jgi:hypothetical protein
MRVPYGTGRTRPRMSRPVRHADPLVLRPPEVRARSRAGDAVRNSREEGDIEYDISPDYRIAAADLATRDRSVPLGRQAGHESVVHMFSSQLHDDETALG